MEMAQTPPWLSRWELSCRCWLIDGVRRNTPDMFQQIKGDQMKKAYEGVAKFVRWVVTGIVSFIVALPTFTSVSTSI